MKFKHQFVEFMPDDIQEGIIYISLEYKSVIHKCACGCGKEVNTPLHSTGWKMIYNGETISLKPSVGNWSFDCKSHYWIINNDVQWSSKWSDEKIRKVRKMENSERQEYYKNKNFENIDNDSSDLIDIPVSKPIKKSWFQKLVFWK
ncbi:DUF6527 family protein [Aequorivita antarctica]|uniref:Uncharacterized protein n=1 Tax=Aequorivita antarctica TaxID=153266 RepID=A0A5C6Z1I1_9FLAO|nr:DUF6527 family protein [Aequorivita antarctica]TXD73555.1 hypothetical protein ESU54_07265 [Aequorivita antarctica]